MPPQPKPLIYVITSGETTTATTPTSQEFNDVLRLIEAASDAGVDLLQIREKVLATKVLFALAERAAEITRGSNTKLLINDRADVAAAAGAHGVHLTSHSLPVEIVRRSFGADFLIGVSTHSLPEARSVRDAGANFAIFGPVYATPAKSQLGAPVGLEQLKKVCTELEDFPILAIGGITVTSAVYCLKAGAQGVAAIRMFNDLGQLSWVVKRIRRLHD